MKMPRLWKSCAALLLALLAMLTLYGAAQTRTRVVRAEALPLPLHAQEDQGTSLASQPSSTFIEPTNYCVSCHSAEDPRLQSASAWRGGSASLASSPCPAVVSIQEQLYYTERMLLAIERGLDSIGAQAESPAIQARYQAAVEGYARLRDTPVDSLDAFEFEAQALRYQMGKLHTQINAVADAQQKRIVLIFGVAVTLFVLASLIWGLSNTRKVRGGLARKPRLIYYIMVGVFLLLVFGLFSLPLFRPVVAEVETPTLEEQVIAAAHDTASRLAAAADRADSRAWMFSRVAAAWDAQDPAQALAVLESGLDAVTHSINDDHALWGEAAHVSEISVGDKTKLEEAALIASQLNAARSRGWALALIGAEWAQVDSQRAQEIFAQALGAVQTAPGIYRDLDLRKIAVEWSRLDPKHGLEVTHQIADPGLKSWALREIAQQTNDPQLFIGAAEAALQVQDAFQRARLLREIAVLSGDQALFQQALSALENQQGILFAYALGDLAAASNNLALVEQIDPRFSAARTFALLRLGRYPEAWDVSLKIEDPYEQALAQAEIVSAWAALPDSPAAQKAQQIQVPVLRARAMRDVILRTGDASLVELIDIAYYRVQALTSLSQFASAGEAAADLKEPYPLVGLGTAWAQSDPNSAVQVLDALKREADKAMVLQALAQVTSDPQLFERALGMAQAARVSNDPLAPAVASLNLHSVALTPAQALQALQQALEITERISIK